jgi:hypothetical protein
MTSIISKNLQKVLSSQRFRSELARRSGAVIASSTPVTSAKTTDRAFSTMVMEQGTLCDSQGYDAYSFGYRVVAPSTTMEFFDMDVEDYDSQSLHMCTPFTNYGAESAGFLSSEDVSHILQAHDGWSKILELKKQISDDAYLSDCEEMQPGWDKNVTA